MKNQKNTQRAKVKAYLESGRPITSWEAIEKFHCSRLSAVIYSLRYEYNMNIATEMFEENGTRCAKYVLKANPIVKESIKEYLLRGSYLTEEIAQQVFECDNVKLVLNELKGEGLNVVSKQKTPLCGKPFTIWTIGK